MRIKFISVVVVASTVLFSFIWGLHHTIEAKASCVIIDETYNYHLECIGDKGSCKFIPPEGEPFYCTGNKTNVYPLPGLPTG